MLSTGKSLKAFVPALYCNTVAADFFAGNSSGGQQKWNRSVGTPSKRFPKTGTPIDNLISVSGLNNVKTTNPSKPQITSDVIKKNSKSLKDTGKFEASQYF